MKNLWMIFSLIICSTSFSKDTVNVVVHEMAPMVMENENGQIEGFDIDVFNHVANELNIVPNYIMVSKFYEIFDHIDDGKADLGIAGITINYDRSTKYDFSYPYKKSGLSILIRDEYELSTYDAVVTMVTGEDFISTIGYFIVFFCFASLLIWYTERGSDSIADTFIHEDVDESGIEEAAWFLVAVVTTIGWGDITVRKRLSRFAVVITVFVGFTMFASLMGQFSAISEAQLETYSINNYHELKGKKVAVVGGTTSELQNIGARITTAKTSNEAVLLLEAKKVDAVVFDAPTLQYFAKENDDLTTVGGMFHLQDYGIAMKKGSELRDNISMKVLKFMESDKYKASQQKWFGQND